MQLGRNGCPMPIFCTMLVKLLTKTAHYTYFTL